METPERGVLGPWKVRVGQVFRHGGEVWRWDGKRFWALQVGDVCLTRDPLVWQRWDGHRWKGGGWRKVRIEPGALVAVRVGETWSLMRDQVRTVLEVTRREGRSYVRVQRPFSREDPVEVPVDVVMPLARADEFTGEEGRTDG